LLREVSYCVDYRDGDGLLVGRLFSLVPGLSPTNVAALHRASVSCGMSYPILHSSLTVHVVTNGEIDGRSAKCPDRQHGHLAVRRFYLWHGALQRQTRDPLALWLILKIKQLY
jgi:hypothetical protein